MGGADCLRMLRQNALLFFGMCLLVGMGGAVFLAGLDFVTRLRYAHGWVVWWLPFGGIMTVWIYQRWGRDAGRGTDRILEWIREPEKPGAFGRMGGMIVGGTWLTHLLGGSAGREGTALQMGGGFAAALALRAGLSGDQARIFVMSGLAAGFGAVFGTPLAGAVFAVEVVKCGAVWRRPALLGTALVAALCADGVCRVLGVEHGVPVLAESAGLFSGESLGLGALMRRCMGLGMVAACFGMFARGYVALHGKACGFWARWVQPAGLRAAAGGVAVLGVTLLLGTRDYLGLGVWAPGPGPVVLGSFFGTEPVPVWAWFWKMLLTVLTVSSGFKGGEVTPLFYMGASLGNALSRVPGLVAAEGSLLAAAGMVAVFAGASKAPLACAVLGGELFGWQHVPVFLVTCWIADRVSGNRGLYGVRNPAA